LANALYPLIEATEPLEAILEQYKTDFDIESLKMMRSKLGLQIESPSDKLLLQDLEDLLQLTETDMTIFFRNLSRFKSEKPSEGFAVIEKAFYTLDDLSDSIIEQWNNWFLRYAKRLQDESFSDEERKAAMNAVNPKYVLRNYMAQLAIDDATKGDYGVIEELFNLLKKPYDEQPELEKWFAKRPEWARNKVGCSMLSCSS